MHHAVPEPADTSKLKSMILDAMSGTCLDSDVYRNMLDYTIELFESQGLGVDYYGYHNIVHELEVVYVALMAIWGDKAANFTEEDTKYLYVAALLHDFEPQKDADKPLENSVLEFIGDDRRLIELVKEASLDIDVIASLIHRTVYPFEGQNKYRAEHEIAALHERAGLDADQRAKNLWMGWFLSIVDRIAGYALGPFEKALEMAKMNAHALGWHPHVIAQRSVSYFEQILNGETTMTQFVLGSLSRDMRQCLMNNVLEFFELRRNEIRIQAEYVYENLSLNPFIENYKTRTDPGFVDEIRAIYDELPHPLKISQYTFKETVMDPDFIVNTLRIGSAGGKIVGFARGGPLEKYQLRPEINDEYYGDGNTIFLEPMALKTGYWGLGGGSGMRNMFAMQAHSKHYRYLTSFALRDVIQNRIDGGERIEFVTKFNPERWDYYRVEI